MIAGALIATPAPALTLASAAESAAESSAGGITADSTAGKGLEIIADEAVLDLEDLDDEVSVAGSGIDCLRNTVRSLNYCLWQFDLIVFHYPGLACLDGRVL